MTVIDVLNRIQGGLIVSCQSSPGDPTHFTEAIVAFARAAEIGGAVGLRLNGPDNVAAVRAQTALPVIAIHKRPGSDGRILITGRLEDIPPLIDAGAKIIAFDSTDRPRPVPCTKLVAAIHAGGALAMADIRTYADADEAIALGVDLIATTLSVFDLPDYVPDVDLVRQIVAQLPVPIIAEGNYWEPADFVRALEAGAHAVVIGSVITRPWKITERFVLAAHQHSGRTGHQEPMTRNQPPVL